ncbi:Bug family tripartite tricarboxylate transporter substrate binding protein [Roseomonas harenae]|uniref:Bug family tripartite tricarboxylate transporter substrate binding protein n=1 Tax=Muricoccus harenae TaxID=2692566 RepID=UPI00133134EC|nr:tripartite tricarboxylate transporter substrate-binding protein [Roseomonas harenae]
MCSLDRRTVLALGIAGVDRTPRSVQAQETAVYPTRPVRLLVGFAPGGSLDVVARMLAEPLTQRLGQPFLVENRLGATGNLAAEAVVRALPPDGHLLLMGNPQNLTVNAALQRNLPFDPARDLVPVAQVATVPYVVVVPANLPARSFADLIALARARPGQLNAGTPGIASLQHLALELIKLRSGGLDMTHIPFRGGSEVNRELLGGRLQVGIDTLVSFGPGIDSGGLRPLATLHADRLPTHPALPAVAETPGFEDIEVSGFIGFAGPAGMPRPAITRLEAAALRAVSETDLPARFASQGVLAQPAGAEPFGAMLARDRDKWARVVRQAAITLG